MAAPSVLNSRCCHPVSLICRSVRFSKPKKRHELCEGTDVLFSSTFIHMLLYTYNIVRILCIFIFFLIVMCHPGANARANV